MPKSPLSAVLQDERASIDQQIQKLERRRTGIDELLKQYSDSASPAGRTTKPASTQKGALSNMEMVRQVLKAKHAEMNVKEIRVGIREKFRVEASKNLPQLLHKASTNKSSVYKNGRTQKYGLLTWKESRKAS